MNPYTILATLLVFAVACAGSAWVGYDYRDGKVAQQVAKLQADTIKKAQADAATDLQSSIARVRAEAIAKERSRAAKTAGVNDATLKANPDCRRDDVSISLLNTAIASANDSTPATRGMSHDLRAPAETSGRK